MERNRRLSCLLTSFLLFLTSFSVIGLLPIVQAEGTWESIQAISKTIEVPPGQEYYAYFEGDTRTLNEVYLPGPEVGFSQKAQDALDEIPGWLYPDMVKKFTELGEREMDSGDFATPIFADLDADGDLDLSSGSDIGILYYYENVGTVNKPVYKPDMEMYLHISMEHLIDTSKTSMALGDWDGDLDLDLLVGNVDGDIIMFENIGTPTQALWNYSAWGYGFVDGNSHPALVDLDNDLDLDVAIGAGNGYIYFYENIGTPVDPLWTFDYNIITGEDDSRAICFGDMDDDGDYDLTVGDGDFATLYFYRNIGSETQEIWFEDTMMYSGVSPEYGTSPSVADINGDRRPDLLVGGNSGRMFLYQNSGSAQDPNWLIWSSYQVVEGYNYYPKEKMMMYMDDIQMDKYAELILGAQSKYKDEIAFAISHTPTENLKALSTNQSQIFVENAELIYEIDQYLDYVQVIEKGDYTTTRYKFGEPGSTIERELPRDIYYWYIVHPKITGENVHYVHPNDSDPDHPTDPADGGRFWREYLFYHADENYPPDNSGAPDDGVDDYPQDINPPLLKDLLSGITTLWNGTKHYAPGDRPMYYGENAVVRVSNWVGGTLILNQQEVSDGERPTQPVRIAHHHNGNCGELQDLSVPAARTALIPAAGVLLLGEDHVWNEFYEDGWHQWDNYWSHGGSVINNSENYWVGWGERGGSGIWKHGGDDDTWEVTDRYIPEEDLNHVTIRVMDNNGDPVDGARVLVITYWLTVDLEGYQIDIPFPAIWNYTDANGETLFKLATQTKNNGNHNFTFKIISKVGSMESGKLELEHGQDYNFSFFLEGSAPNPELNTNQQPNPNPQDLEYRLGISYQVKKGTQYPRHPETGNHHPEEIPPERLPDGSISDFRGNHIDSFLTDELGFFEYMKGYNFDSYEYAENSNTDAFEFDIPDFDNWYFVLSNRDSIETTKLIDLTLELFYKVQPYQVRITEPQNGASLNIGGQVPISGIVTNESELVSLKISTNGGSTWTFISQSEGQWTYFWDTGSLGMGFYDIEVMATFQSSQNSDLIQLELVDSEPPLVDIGNPPDYSMFNIGQNVLISGTVIDNVQVSGLSISFDDGDTWVNILSGLSGDSWSYNWNTAGLDPGGFIIKVRASDGSHTGYASGYIELEDRTPPTVSITEPDSNKIINIGSLENISGEVQDNGKIISLLLSCNSGDTWIDVLASLNGNKWSYEWNTGGTSAGLRTLIINASDGTYFDIYSVDVNMVDSESPIITISDPSDGSLINLGGTITISGSVNDNVVVTQLRIRTGGGNWINILPNLNGNSWSYSWDTTGNSLGSYSISVKASDGTNEDTESIRLEIVDAQIPSLEITQPGQGGQFNCGETISISGFVSDNSEIAELEISIDEENWIDILPDLEDGNWDYLWDTSGLASGQYSISVRTSDGINSQVSETVQIRLIDGVDPVLEIISPTILDEHEIGDLLVIEGKLTDDVGITEFSISLDNGLSWIDMYPELDSRGKWSYLWDTRDLKPGQYTVLFKMSDGSNEIEDQMVLELKGKEGSDDDLEIPPVLMLLASIVAIILVTIAIVAVSRLRNKKIDY